MSTHTWTKDTNVRYAPVNVYHDVPESSILQFEQSRSALFFYQSVNVVISPLARESNGRIHKSKSGLEIPLDQRVQVRILGSSHVLSGQRGLFATRDMMPRSWILDYTGVVVRGSPQSDYVLRFHEDFAIDAARIGNEARFINDYRGTKACPNVEFRNYVVGDPALNNVLKSGKGLGNMKDEDVPSGPIKIGVFVGKEPIQKGDELLVSYGKAFWKARNESLESSSF